MPSVRAAGLLRGPAARTPSLRRVQPVKQPTYVEFRPHPQLADVLTCEWERRAGSESSLVVLPDGCADIVWRSDGALFVAGPDLGPALHDQGPGIGFVGLRMMPGTAATVLGTDVDELRDRQVSLSSVWGSHAVSLADRLADASSMGACRAILAAAVRERVAAATCDDQVVAAARLLSTAPMRVTDLAEQVGISDRQLRRRFVRQVGYGPKTYERVMRFRRFQESGMRTGGQRVGLAHLAATAGYADQAHLTRECRRLAGRTPTQLLDSLAAPSGSDRDDRIVQDNSSIEPRPS